MEYTILETGWYQIPFSVEQGSVLFTDALVLTPEEYAELTPEAFSIIKRQRYDAWKSAIDEMSQDPIVPEQVVVTEEVV
jgi:hypothetical protein